MRAKRCERRSEWFPLLYASISFIISTQSGAFGKSVKGEAPSATAIFQRAEQQEESENVGDENGLVGVRLPLNDEKNNDDDEGESEKAPSHYGLRMYGTDAFIS